jgi:molybdopterin/thiamine biosynthesis adenylyltransferase/ubiquinone/menaquinone biosynthesis C-methylase UbiE
MTPERGRPKRKYFTRISRRVPTDLDREAYTGGVEKNAKRGEAMDHLLTEGPDSRKGETGSTKPVAAGSEKKTLPNQKSGAAKKIAQAYDSPSWWYDIRGFFILTFAYQSTLWAQIHFFARNIREHHLEVAIGSGTLFGMIVRFLRWKGRTLPSTVGVDYAPPMLAGAYRRFKNQKNMILYEGDVTRLPESDETFSTVNMANAFHCFPDPLAALREIYRVMVPGGTLAMNVILYPRKKGIFARIANAINRWGKKKGILHSPYRVEEVRTLLSQSGFTLLEEKISGNCHFVVAERPSQTAVAEGSPSFDYARAFCRNEGLVTRWEQARLRAATVAVAGLGGVGGVHLTTLARLGVGGFHMADLDTFEIENMNRQVGASLQSLGAQKVEIMAEHTRQINPDVRLKTFSKGINAININEFLHGVDVVVDGLDFFALEAREILFDAAERRGIPIVTAGPIGMSSAWLVFQPGGMPWRDYFRLDLAESREDKLLLFALGLTPKATQMSYMDPRSVSLAERRGPSLSLAVQLCAGVASGEVLKIILNRGKVESAPRYKQFDVYRNRFVSGQLSWGNGGILQRLKFYVYRWWLGRGSFKRRSS